jgi:pyruvate dehydrogenase E1 component alpha subunit/2-oxoisovalerate dehydrogenase E1 component alpha subunit
LQRAAGYGVEGCKIDGTDPRACIQAIHAAVARARAGAGPQMIVADLLRLAGHGEHDDFGYVNHDLQISPIGRDCLKVARDQMIESDWATSSQLDAMRKQARSEVEAACAVAMREPAPDPHTEDWCALSARTYAEGFAEAN